METHEVILPILGSVPDWCEGEIIRCRDCKHCYETWSGYECERFSGEYHRAELNGFCAWGKRKEGGDD